MLTVFLKVELCSHGFVLPSFKYFMHQSICTVTPTEVKGCIILLLVVTLSLCSSFTELKPNFDKQFLSNSCKILINSALDKHIQAKTNDKRVPCFSNILVPLSRKTKLNNYAISRVTKSSQSLICWSIFQPT